MKKAVKARRLFLCSMQTAGLGVGAWVELGDYLELDDGAGTEATDVGVGRKKASERASCVCGTDTKKPKSESEEAGATTSDDLRLGNWRNLVRGWEEVVLSGRI